MSKIQWEYDLVERPFCEQLKALGRAMPDWQKRKDTLAGKAKDFLVFGLAVQRFVPVKRGNWRECHHRSATGAVLTGREALVLWPDECEA